MADKLLPGVNFNSNPGLDEFDFLHSTYSQEFRYRAGISGSYGIVDTAANPAKTPFTSDRPLSVQVSPVNPLTIDISPGFAVTSNRMLINIDATVPSVPLTNITAGKVYVVCVEYVLIPNGTTRVNRYGVPITTRLFRPSNTPPDGSASTLINAITIADLNDFNNPSLFPDDRKSVIVPIGIVTVLSDPLTSQLTLSVDLTNVTYDFNRPWYSPQDVEHRSMVGSGLISDNNPHGYALQDLSSAGFTLYQQLTPKGSVIAKDSVYYGYPGKFCTELITLNRFEADYRGTITTPAGEIPLGGSWFFKTVNLPVRPGSLYLQETPWQPIPYHWIEGTRIIVLGSLESPTQYTAPLTFEYFSVQALETGSESPTQGVSTLTVNTPIDGQEFIISGGLVLNSLAQTSVSLPSLLGPIKKKYQILCQPQGTLLIAPQPIVTSVKVQDLVGAVKTVNQGPSGGRGVSLVVGLTGVVEGERLTIGGTNYDLNVQLQITGFGDTGAALQEVITFRASQWKEQDPTALVEQPMQFQTTKGKFSMVSSLTLMNTGSEPHNSGPDSILSIWANVLESSVNQELAQVSSFFWTGSSGVQVKDERDIYTSIEVLNTRYPRMPWLMPESDFSFATELFSTILAPPLTTRPIKRLAVELNDDRMLGETWKSFSASDTSGEINKVGTALLYPGIFIRLTEDKTLTLVTGSLPRLDRGEVSIDTANDDMFRNNMVATINDPTFDSSWYATLATTANPPVELTRQLSYPDGFMINDRQHIVFSGDLILGNSIDITINGEDLPTVTFDGTFITSHAAMVVAIVYAINTSSTQFSWGLNAIVADALTSRKIIINGNNRFEDFTIDSCVLTGGGPGVVVADEVSPFEFVNPTGGSLPTAHLPQRYPDHHTPWEYISRPLLWEGAGLEGAISWTNDNPNQIVDKDTIEIATGKILIARRGVSNYNPAIGEFLVDPASLVNTIDSALATINDTRYASGLHAYVKEFGFDSTRVDISADTLASGSPNPFLNDDEIIFTILDGGSLPAPLSAGTIYYVVGATPMSLQVSLSSGGSPIDLSDVGTTGKPFRATSNKVLVRSAGYANSLMDVISEGLPGTWILDPFVTVGSGDISGHAILKTVRPLAEAMWRCQTTDSVGMWSQWLQMRLHSPTAFVMDVSVGKSLYAVQFKLKSQEYGDANAWSLYQFTPDVASSTLQTLDTRLTDVEVEISASRGSAGSLNARLDNGLNPDGTLIKDDELVDARESLVHTVSATLKPRLDIAEGLTRWLTGGTENWNMPNNMVQPTIENLLIGGPTLNGNSNFISSGTTTVTIGGSSGNPLIFSINGYSYVYKRGLTTDFTGQSANTYYLYADSTSNPMGLQTISSTATALVPAHTSIFTDSTAPFISPNAVGGYYLVIPSILINSVPFSCPIRSVISPTQIEITGSFPSTIPSSTAYQIYSTRELQFAFTSTKTDVSNRLYLGEVAWTGSGFSYVINYRYLNKYVSSLNEVTAAPNYLLTIPHGLGSLPRNFTLYVHFNSSGDAQPKVLNIGDEVLIKTDTNNMYVKNRYASMVARDWDGNVQTHAWIQLVI